MVPRFETSLSWTARWTCHLSEGRGAVESFEGVSVQARCLRIAKSPMLAYSFWVRVSNKPFSFDLRRLAGSAVVPVCTSGRVLHGVFGVLRRLWQTKQVASP